MAAFSGAVDPHWHVPIALILLVGAALVAVLRHDRQSLTLDALALAVVLAAVFSAAHIVDTPYPYLVRWMWAVGGIVWLAIAWSAWRVMPVGIRRGITTSRLPVALVALLAGWLAVTAIHADFPVQSDQASLANIAPAVRLTLRGLPGPVLVEAAPDFVSGLVAEGVLLIAIHAGIDARLPDQSDNVVGTAHTSSEVSAGSTVVVVVDDLIDAYRHNPAYRSVASYDPSLRQRTRFHSRFDIEAHDAPLRPECRSGSMARGPRGRPGPNTRVRHARPGHRRVPQNRVSTAPPRPNTTDELEQFERRRCDPLHVSWRRGTRLARDPCDGFAVAHRQLGRLGCERPPDDRDGAR